MVKNQKPQLPSTNCMKQMLTAEFSKMLGIFKGSVKKYFITISCSLKIFFFLCFTELLKENDSKFAFTVDGWSARNASSFYGITVHFVGHEFLLNGYALDLPAAMGQHTAKDIANFFLRPLKSLICWKKYKASP